MVASETMTKQAFKDSLDQKIVGALNVSREKFLELSYLSESDKRKMENLLLLFNVESVYNLQNPTERYSFSHSQERRGMEP